MEKGNVLLGVAIVLGIMVVGIIWIMSVMGYDFVQPAKNCYEVVYQSGAKELLCH